MKATATPKLDRTIELHDGRRIGYAEWGDLKGRSVVLLHGEPGSRLLCPDEEATVRAGVRLITIDRSGYGRSDPRPHPTIRNWADDFAEFAERLDLDPCPVVGWSGGGPYALAAAFGAPESVTVVGLAASIGPLDYVPGQWDEVPPEGRTQNAALRADPDAPIDRINRLTQWYADDWRQWSADLPDDGADGRLFAQPEIMDSFNECFREGARQGAAGLISDWIAEVLPWGFSVADIHQDVHVWWGDADRVVGREHADYLAGAIPRSRLVIYPNEGHIFPVMHWGEMLLALT